jgi:hypothetical protein
LKAVVLIAGLVALPPALAQGQKRPTVYEPSQRLRTAIESCMKDEVMNGANCVKKCQPDFRMDLTTRPPTCYALKPDAKYVPPTPGYVTPEKPVASSGKGA